MRGDLQSHGRWSLLAVVLVVLSCTSCGEEDGRTVCSDVNCLRQALTEASPGSVVELSAGTYEGAFDLPAGVSLIGTGTAVLKFFGEKEVLSVAADGVGTSVQNLSFESGAGGAIKAKGSGGLELKNLNISVTGGFALLVRDLDSLTAQNLTLSGNVTKDMAPGIPAPPDPNKYAVAGMALLDVGNAELNRITASGLAYCGVLFHNTTANWDEGEVFNLVGSGIHTTGSGDVTVRNVQVHDVWGGATPFGYGFVASNGVHLVTENVTASDNEVAGMLIDRATGEHTDAVILRNGNRGVWIQHCQPTGGARAGYAVSFHGPDTSLDANGGVAFGVFQSTGISLSDGHLDSTSKVPMIPYRTETADTVDIGDGIEVIESNQLVFTGLSLENNSRAGILVDGGGDESTIIDVTFEDVTIGGAEGDRGFVEQYGTPTSAPDVVEQTLIDADLTGGTLEVVDELNISNVPSPEQIIDIEI